MEVREKKIKKSSGEKGVGGGEMKAEKKERNKMGTRAERWKKNYLKRKVRKRLRVRGKHAITL